MELDINLEIAFVGVRGHASELLTFNPAGKVPTLVTDDGYALADTRIICETFQTGSEKMFLARLGDSERRAQEGLAVGFLDGVAVWVREQRREAEDRSSGVIELERARAIRCLAHFELHWPFDNRAIDFANAALVSAIELMHTRVAADLIENYPALCQWYGAISQYESFSNTRPESA